MLMPCLNLSCALLVRPLDGMDAPQDGPVCRKRLGPRKLIIHCFHTSTCRGSWSTGFAVNISTPMQTSPGAQFGATWKSMRAGWTPCTRRLGQGCRMPLTPRSGDRIQR